MTKLEIGSPDKNESNVDCDEPFENTGHGRYNYLLLIACSIITNGVALDMFGCGLVVAASSCELQLGLREIGLLTSIPFAGLLVAFVWGFYADTKGRRRVLLVSTSVGFVFAVLSSFSPNWQTLLVCKLIGCSFSAPSLTLTLTYVGESTISKYRDRYLFIITSTNLASEVVSFTLAYFILPLTFSYPIPWLSISFCSWRLFTLIMALPLGVGAVMLIFCHETPEFLINQGQEEKAVEVLKKIYKMNGGKMEEFSMKRLTTTRVNDREAVSLWKSLVLQTAPLFKKPLLWRTLQLTFLTIVCCCPNNIFLMWFPTIINMFFKMVVDGSSASKGFCQSIKDNIKNTTLISHDESCVNTVSIEVIYSGIITGAIFTSLNLMVSRFSRYRRLVMVMAYAMSATSAVLVPILTDPLPSIVFFALIQISVLSMGSLASYLVDMYPTSYRAMVNMLTFMAARVVSFCGVMAVGAVIADHCAPTFYGTAAIVLCGAGATLLLP